MYNQAPYGRRPLGLAALVSMLSVSPIEAAVVAHFDFEDPAGNFSNLAEQVAPHLTVSAWSDADRTLTSATEKPGFSMIARSFANGNDYLLTITPSSGFKFGLTGIAFDHRISDTGPTAWELWLNGVPIDHGTTSTSYKTDAVTVGATASVDPLLLAIHGSGAGSSAGTLRLDNVTLSGDVSAVPLPASIWLLGPALAGLSRRRLAAG